MEVQSNLRMNGGEGDASYALNSYIQARGLAITRPLLEKTVEDVERSKYINCSQSFVMADIGCASGPNTMSVISTVVGVLRKFREELKRQSSILEIQVYLNDLPGNDFNSIFRSIPKYIQACNDDDMSCYLAGVPGTFHGRLFPRRSLHFVNASYSVHWLSKLPSGVCNQTMSKGRVYISKPSPLNVWKAYLEQFKEDFTRFLQHRSQEIVEDGRMVMILPSRDAFDPTRKETAPDMKLLGDVLLAMQFEGLIEEEKLDTFHMPLYRPTTQELEDIVSIEGSFTIERMESFAFDAVEDKVKDMWINAEKVAKYIRSFTEPLISHHFGEKIMDVLYEKLTDSLMVFMSKEVLEIFNVIVVLKRKI